MSEPEDVRELAARRSAARAARDFDEADALRDEIAARGYRVVDEPDGWSLAPIEPERAPRIRAADVPSVLEEPADAEASFNWLLEGWPEDVARALDGVRPHLGDRRAQLVVTVVSAEDPGDLGPDVEVVALEPGTGWGAARNAGLRRSRGRVIVVLDGSIEPTGDVLGPIATALDDPSTGVCGPFGISTQDLRSFEESHGVGEGREVDAIEGYLMAFRRDVLRDVGLFDEHFKWYRTADIELSFRLRDAGYRARVVDVPVTKHEHRMWASTPPDERDRLSKRNFYRFLERFRDRFDLLTSRPAD
jgi:glycosyltransferase involved in cell wall biosynthesis